MRTNRNRSIYIHMYLLTIYIISMYSRTFIDHEITINLQKMNKAETWDCALRGHTGQKLDDYTKEETKKKLLLERFQEEVVLLSCIVNTYIIM